MVVKCVRNEVKTLKFNNENFIILRKPGKVNGMLAFTLLDKAKGHHKLVLKVTVNILSIRQFLIHLRFLNDHHFILAETLRTWK